MFADGFDEDVDGFSDERLVDGGAYFGLEGEELVVAESFDIFGDIIGEAGVGGSAWAGGIFEDEGVFELGIAEEIEGELVVGVGFAWEAADDVGAEEGIWEDLSDAGEEVAVLVDGVAAVHGFEDAVGAGLDGEVDVLADAGAGGDGVEDVVAEVAGEGGDEA